MFIKIFIRSKQHTRGLAFLVKQFMKSCKAWTMRSYGSNFHDRAFARFSLRGSRNTNNTFETPSTAMKNHVI